MNYSRYLNSRLVLKFLHLSLRAVSDFFITIVKLSLFLSKTGASEMVPFIDSIIASGPCVPLTSRLLRIISLVAHAMNLAFCEVLSSKWSFMDLDWSHQSTGNIFVKISLLIKFGLFVCQNRLTPAMGFTVITSLLTRLTNQKCGPKLGQAGNVLLIFIYLEVLVDNSLI